MSTKIWEQIKSIDVTCANILKNFDLCMDEDLKWICFEDLKTTIFPGESGKVIVQRGKVWKIISANKVPVTFSTSCTSVNEPVILKESFQEEPTKDKDSITSHLHCIEDLSEEEAIQDTNTNTRHIMMQDTNTNTRHIMMQDTNTNIRHMMMQNSRKDCASESCDEEVKEVKMEYDSEYEESNKEYEESSKEKKKPKRFCIFCKRQYAALSRHIKQRHKDEPRLKNLDRESMIKEIEILRREGIIAVNREEAKKAIPVYQAERISKFENNIDLTTCPNCLITVKKTQFSRHKRRCPFLN